VSSRTSSAGRAAIAAAIAKRALRRDVTPEPGLYLDKYRFETDPALLRPLASAFAGLAFDELPTPELLAGREMGAVPLVTALALETDLPFVMVRRGPPTRTAARQVEGVYEEGQHTTLVEDVVVEGGSALAAVDALRQAGLVTEVAVCVVDLGEGGAEALADVGVRLLALFDRRAFAPQRP
jgi:orotate phosphoribosyltransferase